jgi:hypothetical protein
MTERNWKRIKDRVELKLPVRVFCRETPDFSWTEVTRLTNVTPFGAGFTLKHPTEKGRLVQMTIPMPRQLRVFDHLEDQYRIWAIIRHLRPVVQADPKAGQFEVGAAFIGKRPPASYEAEPWKRYDISTKNFEALASLEDIVKPMQTTDQRVGTRHTIPVDMLLEVLNDTGAVQASESTVTENISHKGATIFTTLKIVPGRFIRLTSMQFNLTAHAAVRANSIGVDGIARIHVEFIDKEWPL